MIRDVFLSLFQLLICFFHSRADRISEVSSKCTNRVTLYFEVKLFGSRWFREIATALRASQ